MLPGVIFIMRIRIYLFKSLFPRYRFFRFPYLGDQFVMNVHVQVHTALNAEFSYDLIQILAIRKNIPGLLYIGGRDLVYFYIFRFG